MTIKRILIVEDRAGERDSYRRVAEQYGSVSTAATVEEAERELAAHSSTNLVLSDLHLHDGNKPLDVALRVYRAGTSRGARIVFMTTDINHHEMVSEIREHLQSVKIIEKSVVGVRELMQGLREDQSANLVDTMDLGTAASHDSIRRIVREVIDEMLADLDITWFWVKVRVKARLQCESRREKLAWGVGLTVAGLLAVAVYNFLESAIVEALKQGLQ